MSYHLFTGETHKCKKCEAFFLPFEHELPCPRCGTPATEFYDFLTEAAQGMQIHKSDYGHYSPPAFFVGGLPEHIFLLLCNAFDEVQAAADFPTAMKSHFDGSDWGDQAYLGPHVYEIALRLKEKLAA